MGRTRVEKMWLGGAVVVALLIAVVGYFFIISPQRARTSDVQGQVADAQLQGTTLQTQIASLTSEQKKLATFRTALAQAQEALPTVDDLSASPTLLRTLQAIARQSSTSVSSLTIGDPAAVTPVAAVGTATSATPAPSSTAPAAATTPAPSSLYSVAITTTVSGSTSDLVAFLDRLQHHQPRALLISAVTVGSGTTTGPQTGGAESMSLTMTAFVRPSATAATAAPAAAAAAPTGTSTP